MVFAMTNYVPNNGLTESDCISNHIMGLRDESVYNSLTKSDCIPNYIMGFRLEFLQIDRIV